MRNLLLLIVMLVAFVGTADAKRWRGVNELVWGESSNPADPCLRIGFADAQICYDTVADDWIAKKAGSGFSTILAAGDKSTVGQAFFTSNPDADNGTNNWTNTGGGTFTTSTISVINGLNSFRWDPAAQNDVLRSDQVVIPHKFAGKPCQVEFTYTGGSDNLVKPQVVDFANVKLASATYANLVDGTDFLQTQSATVTRSINFLCPDPSVTNTIALEFNQTAAGNPVEMIFDDVHIGEPKQLAKSISSIHPNGEIFVSCRVNSAAVKQETPPCAWVTSTNNPSTGIIDYAVGPGIFKSQPHCWCSNETSSVNCQSPLLNNSKTSVRSVSFNTSATNVAGGVTIFCKIANE